MAKHWSPYELPDDWSTDLYVGAAPTEPSSMQTRNTEDGHRLTVAIWGDGSAASMFVVGIFTALEGGLGIAAGLRWPTFPEVLEALELVPLEGGLFSLPPLVPGVTDFGKVGTFTQLQVAQIGAQENSPAARRFELSGGGAPPAGLELHRP